MKNLLDISRYINNVKELPEPRYIYGAGKVGHFLFNLFHKNNIEISGFCVTEKGDNPDNINGLNVFTLREIVKKNISPSVIIGAFQHGNSIIEKNLEEIGIEKYIKLPENNIVLMLDNVEERRYNRPIIEVTPKIGCSINCRYCPQKILLREYFKNNSNRKSEMSLDDFKFFLKKIPDNTILDWSGFVEPFLNPVSIEMMEYADKIGFEQNLFTTLQGLDYQTFKRMVKIQFSSVVLHTADKYGYANIPITDSYLNMVKEMVDARKQDGTPFINCANCQFEPNENVTSITSDKVKFYIQMSNRAGNLENDGNILVSKHLNGKITCSRSRLLNHNVLLPDGSVVLCCNDFGMKYTLGNLNSESYEDIQNSTVMKDIIDKLNRNTYDEGFLCRNCIFALKDNDLV